MELQKLLNNANRIVVKVGTSSLTHKTGKLNLFQLEKIVRAIADLYNQGKQVILVTSGAVGAGVGKLGLNAKPKTIPEKQAAAAIGQGVLLHMYEKIFGEYGLTVGQVLLTRDDLSDRKRYLNARNTLLALLRFGVIPIVNENDTVAVEEIRLGDNDTLSALVSGLVDAELLILLSDIDGLYSANPKDNPDAKIIPIIEKITPEIKAIAGGAGSKFGTGGMCTKIEAASIAISSGIPMVIANGAKPGILREITNGDFKGTLFIPRESRLHTKKCWIAFGSNINGKIIVDDGAKKVLLQNGKSLLPSGIIDVDGDFDIGSVVGVVGQKGEEFVRGIVNYSAEEIRKIKGKNTSEIIDVLGYKDYDEVIHRDNLSIKI